MTYRHTFRWSANGKVDLGAHSLGAIVFVSGHLQFAKGVAFHAKFLGRGLSDRERERERDMEDVLVRL